MSDRDPATEHRPPRARPIACDEVLTGLVDIWQHRADYSHWAQHPYHVGTFSSAL